MSGRPRTARGATGRDAGKENDVEAEILSRVIEGVKKAKEHNDESQRLGQEIMVVETDIKTAGCKSYLLFRFDFTYKAQIRLPIRVVSLISCIERR